MKERGERDSDITLAGNNPEDSLNEQVNGISNHPKVSADPPNGGITAWLQVAGSFLLFINNWGIVQSFGAYQTYYESNLLSNYAPSNISWIGTFQASLLIIVGIISGPFYDKGYFRHMVITGSFLIVFGLMMLSISEQYYSIFLTQGLTVGLGSGLIYIPSLAIVSSYFSTKRAFALGIAAAGSALGGIIYPIVFHRLEPRIGFPWATRVMAFMAMALLAIAIALLKPRNTTGGPARKLIDWTALKEWPFVFFTAGLFLIFFGFYSPLFYIPTYAEASLHTSSSLAFYLIAVVNAASIVGRIVPSFMADKTGPLIIVMSSAFVAALLVLAWIGIHSLPGFIVFCVLYGFNSAILVTLPPAVVPWLSPSMDVIGTRLGMAWFPAGMSILVGSPIAAAAADIPNDNFLGMQLFSGVMMAAGGCLMIVPLLHIRKKRKEKGVKGFA